MLSRTTVHEHLNPWSSGTLCSKYGRKAVEARNKFGKFLSLYEINTGLIVTVRDIFEVQWCPESGLLSFGAFQGENLLTSQAQNVSKYLCGKGMFNVVN